MESIENDKVFNSKSDLILMKLKHGITAFMIIHNEGEIVRKALESIKDIADEIIIVHDGPCNNNTLKICRKYTRKIYIRPHKGMCEHHQSFVYRKADYEWVLKIDADEFLSEDLKKNIRRLIREKNVDGYSFVWPLWDGKKYITQGWPRKLVLYRLPKISYFGFPNWGEPKIKGKVIKSNYVLEHHKSKGSPYTWKNFKRDVSNFTRNHARHLLKSPKELDNYQCDIEEYPFHLRIRRTFPILSAIPIAFAGFFKLLTQDKEFLHRNFDVRLKAAITNFFYYLYMGYAVYDEKRKMRSKQT